MPKEVVFVGPRQLEVREYVDRSPGLREIKVANIPSGISHGTEMSHYRGDVIWHHKLVEGLITHRFSLERVPEAYRLIDQRPSEVVKVIDLGLKA